MSTTQPCTTVLQNAQAGSPSARTRNSSTLFGLTYAQGVIVGVASVIPDAHAPTVTVVSPTPGVDPGQPGGFPSSYQLAKDTAIVLQVTDITSGGTPAGLAYVNVDATFIAADGTVVVEGVYRRGNFVGRYIANSYQALIADGVELHVRRTGGWTGRADGISSIVFDADAVDRAGNLSP